MTYIGFPIISLIFEFIFLSLYFSKSRINLFENRIVILMMLINVLGLMLELGCYAVLVFLKIQDSALGMFVLKSYIAYIPIFNLFLTGYIFVLTNKNYNNSKYNMKNYFIKVLLFFLPLTLIIVFITYFYPLEYVNTNEKYYTYGLCTQAIFYSFCILFPIWIARCIYSTLKFKNRKQVNGRIYLLLVGAIVVASAGGLTQFVDRSILIITSAHTIMLTLIYFTIENPDVKMMDELAKNKRIIENQNEDTTNFMFRITQEIKKPIQDLLEIGKQYETVPGSYIVNKAKELGFTVNDVLDVSGMSTRRLKVYNNNYDIHNLMREIKLNIEQRLPKEIKMDYSMSRNVPRLLYGDQILLRKVILSLLDNAIKHTQEGYISLEVDAIVKYDVARIIISVSDTGDGMGLDKINETLSREISEEEYRIDNEKGILNLNDIKHVMPRLDGTFVIKSEINKGTTVSITINEKIVNTEEREIAKKIELYEESLNSGKRVMVVDDDSIELSRIKKIIESKGNSCCSSLFGKDVVEKILKKHKYDLIILDDETDTHSAYEIYQKLKKIKGFDIPVIIMIDDNKEFIKLHYLKDGFSDVILKSKLNDEIIRVLDKKY